MIYAQPLSQLGLLRFATKLACYLGRYTFQYREVCNMKAKYYSIIIFSFLFSFCSKSIESAETNDFHVINGNSYYPKTDWISEINYLDTDLYHMKINDHGIPQIGVKLNKQEYPLILDFGNNDMMFITTELKDKIAYSLTGEYFLNYDGSANPDMFYIKIPEVEIFGKKYTDVKAVIAPWERFSSKPFNGAVSMNYLNDHRFTLDYKRQLLAITSKPFSYDTSSDNYSVIDLIRIRNHTSKIFLMGKMNGIDVLIYFDTGCSKTLVNKELFDTDIISSGKRGALYNGTIKLQFSDISMKMENPIVRNLPSSIKYDYPLGMILGSDVLKYFIFTIDRTSNNNKLIIHK